MKALHSKHMHLPVHPYISDPLWYILIVHPWAMSSVILRRPEHPHTRNIRKTDPVARFQQFQQSWAAQKAPGEKNHKNLRWNVREQMLAQDVVYEKVRFTLQVLIEHNLTP